MTMNFTGENRKYGKQAINKRDQYRMLIMSESVMAYIVNISKNIIEDEIYQLAGGELYPVLEFLGLALPCSFIEASRTIAENYVHEDDREKYIETYRIQSMIDSFERGEDKIVLEYRAKMIDGSEMYLRRVAAMVRSGATGDVLAYVTERDITESKRKENLMNSLAIELSDTRESYETLNKAMQSAVFHVDFDEAGKAKEVVWSDELREMLGYKDEKELPNTMQGFMQILKKEDWSPENDLITQALKVNPGEKSYSVDYRLKNAAGIYRWFRATGNVVRRKDDTPETFYGAFFDINEQKVHDILLQEKLEAYEEMLRLKRETMLDELTGVYNRKGFYEKAAEMIAEKAEELLIVRFNVCGFSVINELYGMEKGDYLLQKIGKELLNISQREGFVVGRFSADYFYLCISKESFSKLKLPRTTAALWSGVDITMVYGVYPVMQQKELPVNVMCDRADTAIDIADRVGNEYIFYYNDEMHRKITRIQEIEAEMEEALWHRQFCIYIQPKYDVDTGTLVGGEALVRWKHPERGMISPGEFIPVFEKNGFIRNLDYYVWEECCAFIRSARDKGLQIPPLSVNVSRIHFYGTGLQRKLEELLGKYRLKPEDLELEITETVYAVDTDVIMEKCDKLRSAGFRIAMDDFGSAYSSLNMLKKLPLDIIKLDLQFLEDDQKEEWKEKGHSIIRNMINMARELKLQVVVEGVETGEQKDFIHDIGKCCVQGYYFARPMPVDDFEKLR